VGYVVQGIAISPDSKLLATCGTDELHVPLKAKTVPRMPDKPGMIVLWDLETLKPVQVLDGSKDCMSVAFSPDGKLVAGGRKYRGARVWNVKTGLDTNTLYEPGGGHQEVYVESILFSWDSRLLIYGAHDKARVWDLRTEELVWVIDDKTSRIRRVALKPNSNELATAGRDESILVFDIGIGRYVREVQVKIENRLEGTARYIWQVSYSPDGNYLACVDLNSDVWLFDTQAYKGEKVWNAELCTSFAFSDDGRFIALGGKKIALYELKSQKQVAELPGGQHLSFSPDGKTLITSGTDLQLNVWDVPTVLAKNG
jgi:WD40 repeat protein